MKSGATADRIVPDWPAPARVRAVVTTRNGPDASARQCGGFDLGARGGDEGDVARHRARLREVLTLPAAPRWLRQVHGTAVVRFDAGETGGQPEADAAVASDSGIVLAILTADCLPVLFCAEDGAGIAAAHAGWRGLCAGVLENTLAGMHTPRERVMAWLGPAIGARSYEVGEEVRAAFLAHDAASGEAFAATRSAHWSCDLHALARRRLRTAGVARIFGGGFDTFADARFHSYRRDGARSGRFASLIWLQDQNNK